MTGSVDSNLGVGRSRFVPGVSYAQVVMGGARLTEIPSKIVSAEAFACCEARAASAFSLSSLQLQGQLILFKIAELQKSLGRAFGDVSLNLVWAENLTEKKISWVKKDGGDLLEQLKQSIEGLKADQESFNKDIKEAVNGKEPGASLRRLQNTISVQLERVSKSKGYFGDKLKSFESKAVQAGLESGTKFQRKERKDIKALRDLFRNLEEQYLAMKSCQDQYGASVISESSAIKACVDAALKVEEKAKEILSKPLGQEGSVLFQFRESSAKNHLALRLNKFSSLLQDLKNKQAGLEIAEQNPESWGVTNTLRYYWS